MKFVSFSALAVMVALVGPVHSAEEPPIDPRTMDLATGPGVDFFEYANGGWIASHPIPPEYSRWGSFIELNERNLAALHAILEDCAAATADDADTENTPRRTLGLFYASGMDEGTINAEGAKPLGPFLDAIGRLENVAELAPLVARMHLADASPLFGFSASVDEKDSTTQIANLVQGGLGLPDRDYYLKTDASSVELRKAYREHVAKMFGLLGDPSEEAGRNADRVLALETKLADASKTRVDLRDPEGNYHKMSVADLQKLAPAFPWPSYFAALGLTDAAVAQIDVGQPEFCQALSGLLASEPLEDWKTYLRWHLVQAAAPYLSNPFVDASFEFYGKTLTGVREQQPRWKRVVRTTDGALGELLGRLYVEKSFPPAAKERALRMVQDLKGVLRGRLETLDWMSPETRKAAVEKLDAMGIKIGYPDKWRDYGGLVVKKQPYVLNVIAAAEFDSHWQLSRIGKPVDPTEWGMTPPTVNAYYSPTRNEIVFPAGILQPPFFYADADDAVNYGGIGAVIGHEMTHGFDDQGRQYDAKGNLRNWWTAEDGKRFKERGQKIIEQFNEYRPIDDLHINGKLTEGENIADLGGLKIAHAALAAARDREGTPPDATVDGFTPEQRFFLSFARIWRMASRPEALRLALATDPHSPPKYRVIGPLSNLPEFARAFSLAPDSPMIRSEDQRVDIW